MEPANFDGYLKDSAAARRFARWVSFCAKVAGTAMVSGLTRVGDTLGLPSNYLQMPQHILRVIALPIPAALFFAAVGCSAPMGPIGGPQLAGCCVTKCCLQHSSAVCDNDDPSIVPPHSNFHPLPTRPVFSPPPAIAGQYEPWPGPNLIPPPETRVEPLEVQNSPSQPDDPPPPPSRITSARTLEEQATAVSSASLRR